MAESANAIANAVIILSPAVRMVASMGKSTVSIITSMVWMAIAFLKLCL